MPRDLRGVHVPDLMYGTAWKEERTEALVRDALAAGFRAIDTANQRKHYHEAGVGAALAAAFADGAVHRDDLFLQTKFTHIDGQDDRLPFDPDAPVGDQVAQSFASSLAHLGVEHLDSLVLHGPTRRDGLGPDDHAAWRAMERLVESGAVSMLGVSNVTARQVADVLAFASEPPVFVQNRCYANRGWDRDVRALCTKHGLVYQGFSLLTANRQVLAHPGVRAIAARHGRTPAQVVFRFAVQVGMLALTGTTDRAHMREDLAIADFALADDEVAVVLGSGA
jgi:diketogulonate reductase-like aldo/keto reductase